MDADVLLVVSVLPTDDNNEAKDIIILLVDLEEARSAMAVLPPDVELPLDDDKYTGRVVGVSLRNGRVVERHTVSLMKKLKDTCSNYYFIQISDKFSTTFEQVKKRWAS